MVCHAKEVAGRDPTKFMGQRALFFAFLGNRCGQRGKDIGLEVWKRPEKFFNSMLVIYFCYYELIFFFLKLMD